jgi:hypothetical protein
MHHLQNLCLVRDQTQSGASTSLKPVLSFRLSCSAALGLWVFAAECHMLLLAFSKARTCTWLFNLHCQQVVAGFRDALRYDAGSQVAHHRPQVHDGNALRPPGVWLIIGS